VVAPLWPVDMLVPRFLFLQEEVNLSRMLNNIDFGSIAVAMEFPDAVVTNIASVTYSAFGPAVDLFDAALSENVPQLVNPINDYFTSVQHPLAARLPLMKASYAVFAIVAYAVTLLLLFPVGKILGKHKYRFIGIIHNGFLCALSWYMCTAIAVTAMASGFSLWNNAAGIDGPHDWRMAKLMWLFYISKLPEFMDTFLMMLKQNYRQVSFLHLYHHSTVFLIWFFVVTKGPGGDAYWSAMLNSGVHVVMYGYYFGTMVFITGPVRNFLNAFKFVITKGQMTQFFLNCVQSVYDLYIVQDLRYPADLIQVYFGYMLTLLALFGNFLIKNKGKRIDGGSPSSSPTSPTPSGKRSKKQQ
jgi:elongation of very long chain fatty acids protein 4